MVIKLSARLDFTAQNTLNQICSPHYSFLKYLLKAIANAKDPKLKQ